MFSEPDDYRLTSTGTGLSLIKKSKAITNPKRHFHPWWEILYIYSGERTFFYANRTLHITEGTFLCIAPGILHRAVNPAGEVCGLYNVFFADDGNALSPNDGRFSLVSPLLESLNPCIPLTAENHRQVSELFSQLGKELLSKNPGYGAMAWAKIIEVLTLAARQNAQSPGKILLPDEATDPKTAAVLDYLNANYTSELTLEGVARRFKISPAHLSRLFKKTTHFNFVEYVNSLRISKACRLLTSTGDSVLNIALACGFGSVTQFGRCFKELTGTSPLKYRKG